MKYVAVAKVKSKITVSGLLKDKITAVVNLNTLNPVALPEILIDSLNGGEPQDITYAPINANNLTGISGGQP